MYTYEFNHTLHFAMNFYRKQAFDERRPDINSDFAGIYPWDWVGDDVASFKALQGGLLVAPILQKLILNRYPVVSVYRLTCYED